MKRLLGVAAGVLALSTLFASRAEASFHQWKISEIFSDASGTVQFIEFQLPGSVIDNESFIGGHTLTASALGRSFTFPGNLPSVPDGTERFLVATPGYAALTGEPAADYLLPANNFFSTAGDTLNFASFTDVVSFTAGQVPTDGVNSRTRTGYGGSFASATNSPTNFNGITATIPEPAPLLGISAVFAGVLVARRQRHEHSLIAISVQRPLLPKLGLTFTARRLAGRHSSQTRTSRG
jgi:hypothetical protein